MDKIFNRLVTLLKDDKELHDAVINWLNAEAEAKRAYAKWRLKKGV